MRARRKTIRHTLTVPEWTPATVDRLLASIGGRIRLKKSDREIIGTYARLQGIPPATGKRRVSLIITLAPRQRAADPDSHWKSVLDALVAAGMLRNDSHVWCELGTVRFERGKCRATTIILEDLQTQEAGDGK